jgi:HlyD family secretion protein
MTANVTIVTAKRDDVLRVPMQALRFSPNKRSGAAPDSPTHKHPSNQARVWINDGGALKPVTITSGLDDGNNVEILTGDLKPGDAVATDKVRTTTTAAGGNSPLRMTRF